MVFFGVFRVFGVTFGIQDTHVYGKWLRIESYGKHIRPKTTETYHESSLFVFLNCVYMSFYQSEIQMISMTTLIHHKYSWIYFLINLMFSLKLKIWLNSNCTVMIIGYIFFLAQGSYFCVLYSRNRLCYDVKTPFFITTE